MPRHPPCALKNLTTQRSTWKYSREPQITKIQVHIKTKIALQDARVHYVVLKQQPHTTHPTHNPQKQGAPVRFGTARKNQKQPNPAPHCCKRSCCLRTQQCAIRNQPPPTTPAFQETPQRASVLTGAVNTRPALFADIPPMSTHRRTSACAMGHNSDNPHPGHAPGNRRLCRGSLERR
jgi:hypothetical protein